MSRLRQRSRLRELTRRRQQTSNNNNGEHTLLDRNIFTPTNVVTEPPSTSVIGAQPTEAARNSPNQSSCGGDPTTQLPMRKPTEERNYSSTITILTRRYTVQSSQQQQTRGDLITIYESDDNIECVEDLVTHGPYNNAEQATGTPGSHQPPGQNPDA